jgi:hypothetical protein
MSTPENPISKYRSASYHHILIACNSTAIVEHITRSSDLTQIINRISNREKYEPRSIQGIDGEYVVLVNGMSDVEFAIDDLSWTNVIAPSGSMDATMTMAVEGRMKILEPLSARFFEVLTDVYNALLTDATNTTFILKTIFTGYPTDPPANVSPDTIVPITNVKPFSFIMTDITAEFSEVGSMYNIEFIGVNNGASKSDALMRASDTRTTVSTTSNKLQDVLEAYMTIINKEYGEHYRAQFQEAAETSPNTRVLGVNYKVELDPLYQDAAYRVDNNSRTISNDGNGNDGTMHFPPNSNIEKNIIRVLNRSTQIEKDLIGGVTIDTTPSYVGEKVIPKVMTTVRTNPANAAPVVSETQVAVGIEITFHIIPHIVTRVPSNLSILSKDGIALPAGSGLLELDYMFTGRNIDVLEYDMKVDMGLAFLQSVSIQNNVSDQPVKTDAGGDVTMPDDGNTNSPRAVVIPPAIRNRNPQSAHARMPVRHQQFRELLAQHASLETIETSVTIIGNPYLLNDFNQPPSAIARSLDSASPNSVAKNWQTTPMYVHIDVRMPDPSAQQNLNNLADGERFAKKFWYDGYYYLFAIQHSFSKGEFTQTLDMFSLPQESSITAVDPNPQTQTLGEKTQ